MNIEIIISLVVIGAALLLGLLGINRGLFRNGSQLLLTIAALLVTLRCWYPFTSWMLGRLDIGSDQLAFAAFWGLFAGVYVLLDALPRSLHDDFTPVYPVGLEGIGSFVAGTLRSLLLAAGLFLSALPYLPKLLPNYDASRMLLPLDRLPVATYSALEDSLTGLPPHAPSRTLLPVAERQANEPLHVIWQ